MVTQERSENNTFAALAHPARRQILDLLVLSPGASLHWIASHFNFTRIAAMKHLSKLEEAGLVISEKEGRERLHYFNPVPIQQIYDRWTDRYSAFWSGHLVDLAERVETKAEERARSAKKRA